MVFLFGREPMTEKISKWFPGHSANLNSFFRICVEGQPKRSPGFRASDQGNKETPGELLIMVPIYVQGNQSKPSGCISNEYVL